MIWRIFIHIFKENYLCIYYIKQITILPGREQHAQYIQAQLKSHTLHWIFPVQERNILHRHSTAIKLGQPSHGQGGERTQPREVWPFYYLLQITVSKQIRHRRSEEPHIAGVKTYAPQYLEINYESGITTGKVSCYHGNRAAMSSEGSNVCALCSVRCYSEVLEKWIIQETKQGGEKTASFEAYHFWSLLKCSEYGQGWSYDAL